ncbi:MAG: 7-carboxy-7-deazaguanine synthase [Pseudomonadota bacterium]
MTYSVKETFLSLQGEGARTGRPAVFVRFTGCNLWSGREQNREAAVCTFCDTDFVGTDGNGGGTFATADQLADHVRGFWPDGIVRPYIVCTGGEPTLQLDKALVRAFKEIGAEIAIETNGTRPVPAGVDWICVSPKEGAPLVQRSGHELKLVFPQAGLMPADLADLEFRYFYLQPMDGVDARQHTADAVAYCLAHPQWQLSLQTHKALGIR